MVVAAENAGVNGIALFKRKRKCIAEHDRDSRRVHARLCSRDIV